MIENLPDTGPEFFIERVTDPLLIEFIETLRLQMHEAIRNDPDKEEQIRQEHNLKVENLLQWFEENYQRWTIA